MSKPIHYQSKKLDLPSLGSLELKYVSCGDVRTYQTFEPEKIDNRQLTLKVIYNQLVEPKFNYEDFSKDVTEKDLKRLIENYIELDKSTFENFSSQGDLVVDFAKTIKKHLKENEEKERLMMEPLRKSAEASFTKMQEAFGRIKNNFPSIEGLSEKPVYSEPIEFISPEQNAWERHGESMDILEKSVLLQEQILSEQKSSSSNAQAALFAARITLAVATATLIVTVFLAK